MRDGDKRGVGGAVDGGRRLAALREAGLSAESDPGMERFARLLGAMVGVPIALVSLVEADRQVFPGFVGLGEPWASARWTPLSHSLCQEVVLSGEPLVINDTEGDERWCGHLAVTEIGVGAYAGVPLTDTDGNVLGSLCAIDTEPRDWTSTDLAYLSDLAAACSAELRLRIVSHRASYAQAQAELEKERADVLAARAREALARSELLLRAAQDLAETTGLAEVRRQVMDLVTGALKPSYVELVLVEGRRLRRLLDPVEAEGAGADDAGWAGIGPDDGEYAGYEVYGLDDDWPAARAARDGTTVVIRGRADLATAGFGPDAVAAWEDLDLRTAICVPLPGPRDPRGALAIGWDVDHDIDITEEAVITALAGYAVRAVERAVYVDHRVAVAHQLQEAMLTAVPRVEGVELAALYRPAAAAELVGGDWYDAYLLPSAADGGEDSPTAATLAISIGDITGHDIHAATLMGQLRSMLRQADLDHPGKEPAQVVMALDHANTALDVDASGTLVHAHLRPAAHGDWEMTWTNAGHPAPMVRGTDGVVHQLDDRDPLLHPYLRIQSRTSHRTTLTPGTTLLLYTDGLVEHRGTHIDDQIEATARLLAEHGDEPLNTLLARIADLVGGDAPNDDIALIALRVAEPG